MAGSDPLWHRRIEAAESAQRLLVETRTDQTRQIDVFAMCEQLGIWLAFFPLDGLLGAYLAEGSGGILVTTRRPVAVQRYTAAHEIGHWRLDHGHGLVLDGEEQILGSSPKESEQLAQVFAANLLMPPLLMFGILERLGVGESITPANAYHLAREAGVSYEASVRQLRHLEVIDDRRLGQLLQVRPLSIKRELARGRRPVNGYADVWPVDEQWDDHELHLRVEDEILISLPENRSTGFRWMLQDQPIRRTPEPPPAPFVYDERADNQQPDLAIRQAQVVAQLREQQADNTRPPGAAVQRAKAPEVRETPERLPVGASAELVGDLYVPSRNPDLDQRPAARKRLAQIGIEPSGTTLPEPLEADPHAGGVGRRMLGIRLTAPGPTELRFVYASPHGEYKTVEDYVIRAAVEPRRSQFTADQAARDPDDAWVEEARARQQLLGPADVGVDIIDIEA